MKWDEVEKGSDSYTSFTTQANEFKDEIVFHETWDAEWHTAYLYDEVEKDWVELGEFSNFESAEQAIERKRNA